MFMTFKKFVSALLTIHTTMEKSAKNVTCPDTGISLQLSAKNVHKKATTILYLKNAFSVPTKLLSGTAPFAQNVPFKVLFGTESIATIAHQDNIGTSHSPNAYHARKAKFTTQLKTFASVLLKHHLCLQMELA